MKAFITGVTGQDGAYLSQLLLNKGYEVHGLVRRSASGSLWRLEELEVADRVTLHAGDLEDAPQLARLLGMVRPDEIYNLAAQSFVKYSFDAPASTVVSNTIGVVNLLEAMREKAPEAKFYQASTSEMFGGMQPRSQDEQTPFHPRSPYAVSKVAAHYMVQNYREAYGLHLNCGILFNHESPLRGLEFVTRKITDGVAQILARKTDKLVLGNMEAQRDWGYAPDYVEAMHLMLQQGTPDDYVIATGNTHSVEDIVELCFNFVGLDSDHFIEQHPAFMRPSDVPVLRGDPAKAKRKLGWEARTTFEQMLTDMLTVDCYRHGVDLITMMGEANVS